jgi:hypothetical protein
MLGLVLAGKTDRIWAAMSNPTVLLLLAFVVWQGVSSIAAAPDVSKSLAIVGWMGLDILILVTLLAGIGDAEQLETMTALAATFAAGLALILFAAHLGGLTSFGTQSTNVGADRSLYGLSWESNILASALAIATFLQLTSSSSRVRAIARFGVPLCLLAIAAALTRAAVLGLGAGLLIWAALGGLQAVSRAMKVLLATAAVAVLIFSVAPVLTAPLTSKLSNPVALHSGTGLVRLKTVRVAVHDITPSSLVLGLGTNTFGQRHTDLTRPGQSVPGYLGALPLQIVYESGLVGVALLLAAFASTHPFRRRSAGRAIGLLTVYLSAAAATSPFWFGLTWLVIALAILSAPAARSASSRGRQAVASLTR